MCRADVHVNVIEKCLHYSGSPKNICDPKTIKTENDNRELCEIRESKTIEMEKSRTPVMNISNCDVKIICGN